MKLGQLSIVAWKNNKIVTLASDFVGSKEKLSEMIPASKSSRDLPSTRRIFQKKKRSSKQRSQTAGSQEKQKSNNIDAP